jgi:hypothetical protein
MLTVRGHATINIIVNDFDMGSAVVGNIYSDMPTINVDNGACTAGAYNHSTRVSARRDVLVKFARFGLVTRASLE